jgi:hypothetical protein
MAKLRSMVGSSSAINGITNANLLPYSLYATNRQMIIDMYEMSAFVPSNAPSPGIER